MTTRRDCQGAAEEQLARPTKRYAFQGLAIDAPALAGGLYVVATPIGNLRDVTLRALQTLAAADLIACEDTRVTRKLTARYAITTPLVSYHEHNAAQARPRLLARIAGGAAVALASDAGTPLVSDPGFKLAREARAAGLMVTAVPGPSAVLAALTVCGLPAEHFLFEGFLPAKQTQRRKRIAQIKPIAATLVLFESPARLAATLADLAAALAPREAAVCRELTKLHEEVRRGDLAALAADYAARGEPRGEIVIVVAPARAEEADTSDLDVLLRQALARTSVKEAVGEIAAVTGQPRREVYQRALALAQALNRDDGR